MHCLYVYTPLPLPIPSGSHTNTCIVSRSASKLHNLLLTQHSLPASTIDTNLRIIQGDIKDPVAVSRTLLIDEVNNEVVDIIISGVGSTPALQFNLLRPVTLQDPRICQDAMTNIVNSLKEIMSGRYPVSSLLRTPSEKGTPSTLGAVPGEAATARENKAGMKKPVIVAISTTGLATAKTRDLPVLMIPLYHWLLKIPHDDKQAMEEVLIDQQTKKKKEEVPIRGSVILRPSLLTDGEKLGVEKVRVGWERSISSSTAQSRDQKGGGKMELGRGMEDDGKPAVGNTIPRADVGNWIYQSIIHSSTTLRDQWVGKAVTLTS